MTSGRLLRHCALIALQVGLLIGLWLASDRLSRGLQWPIPGGVIGLAGLAVLLFCRLLPLRLVERGANWLLAEMLLFFIPPFMAVVDAGRLIAEVGWRLLAVLPLGCLLVMIGTGLVVDRVFRYEQRRHQAREGEHES
jgi:holin-like protein